MKPTVEIFIINYNGENYLEKALESILNIDYSPIRTIFSDNGSKDRSVDIARRFESRGLEIRLRSPGTGGIFSHYNLCLSEARAPYVGIFHNDDLYHPSIVARQIELFLAHPKLDAVLTGGNYIDGKDQSFKTILLPAHLESPVLNPHQVLEHLMTCGNSFLLAPSALFKTDSMKRLGAFALDAGNSGDVEMWLRILFQGQGLGYVNDPLYSHRLTSAQTSGKEEAIRFEASDYFKILERTLKNQTVTPKARVSFERLKQLDLLHAGLNRLANSCDPQLLLDCIDWFSLAENKSATSDFGAVDRFKVYGILKLRPWIHTRLGPWIARRWVQWMEPRTSPLLRLALKLKSQLRSHH